MKKNPTVADILDDDARRAAAQKDINKIIITFVVVKIGVVAACTIGLRILAKKLEQS